MRVTVAAIVVTYNRKTLLLECIGALLDQSYPIEKVYIVNNHSTDGTLDYLRSYGFTTHERIEVITLDENTGGAGGFHYGLEKAVQDGFDWYWLMDDDCLPRTNCLEELLNSEKGEYLSPLVIAKEDRETSIWWPEIKSHTGLWLINSIPFNGALIHSSIVEKQGLPLKELFIFGDDVEYSFRARKNNCNLYVNTKAILFHPKNRSDIVSAFFNKIKIPVHNTKIKHYCYVRNNLYLSREYGKFLGSKLYRQIIKQIYYSVFIDRTNFRLVFWAIVHGWSRNLSQTLKFKEL